MKIALISPKAPDPRGYFNFRMTPSYYRRIYEYAFRLLMDNRFRIPQSQKVCLGGPITTLLTLKAATPDNVVVELYDELIHNLPMDRFKDFDLVGISATTINITRGYELLEELRAMGVQTAIGGVHASLVPEECKAYADAVCVGEAENYWEELLQDAQRKELKPFYRSDRPVEMDEVNQFTYDLYSGEHLPLYSPVFSRGCPHRCDFCALPHLYHGYRHRSVDSVIDDIRNSGARHIFFTDAIFFGGGRDLALEMLHGLKSCNVKWYAQTSIRSLVDEEILDAMMESGCSIMGMGFESLSEANIERMNKKHNSIGDYEEIIRQLHERSIAISGDFLFGYDADEIDTFDNVLDFIVRNGIELPEIFMFVPYPGTAAHDRLVEEHRICTTDWSLYTTYGDLPVFQPINFSREVLRDGVAYVDLKCYSIGNIYRRLRNAKCKNSIVWMLNFALSRKVKGVHGRWRGELILKELSKRSFA